MNNRNDFYREAQHSLAGLTELGTSLSVTHCTVPELTALVDTSLQKCMTYDAARHDKRKAFDSLRKERISVRKYIETARNHLTGFFGNVWSESWAQIGFIDQQLKLPVTDARRQRILIGMKTYFSGHPTHENQALQVTALEAEARLVALNLAMANSRDCKMKQRVCREERDAAEAALYAKLQVLWRELDAVLSAKDPRWLKFIDRIPADPRTPDQIEEVNAVAHQGGIISIEWKGANRASRYKVMKQIIGVDSEPILAMTIAQNDTELTGIPAGAVVKLQIVPTNSVGDGPASPPIQLHAA